MGADDGPLGGDDDDGALGVTVGPGPVGMGQVEAVDLDIVAVAPAGFGGGEPSVSQLGIGEGAPRHQVADRATSWEEHVAHRPYRLMGGGVGEQVATGDVAGGVDRRDRGPHAVVDHHALGRGGDADAVKAQALGVGPPAHGDQ